MTRQDPTPLDRRPTVAVIGAGFSGLLTALHLLDNPEGPKVRLIERRSAFGAGAAYSTTNQDHLLNVRAANMSAYPDRPSHFIDWLSQGGAGTAGAAFVTRGRYGAYLQGLLRAAPESHAAGRLILEADEAVELRPAPRGWTVIMGMGRSFAADAAVLAVGNLPPYLPPGIDPAIVRHPSYFGDPWSADFDRLPDAGCAVILGTGLTMVDLALRLAAERPGLKMVALSRRGLLPRSHLPSGPAPNHVPAAAGQTPLELLRRLRAETASGEWRSVVDGLRPQVQEVWRSWDLTERNRFLRHLRPWWDIHRHRLAPPVAAKLDGLTGSGMLAVAAGRITSVEPVGKGLEVVWTPRGGRADARRIQAIALVNCTGPNGDLTQIGDPLLSGLVEQGLIRADACRLGLDVAADGRLLDREGAANPALYAVGPPTRGEFWEMTSVPDIRIQAGQCAVAIIARTCGAPVG